MTCNLQGQLIARHTGENGCKGILSENWYNFKLSLPFSHVMFATCTMAREQKSVGKKLFWTFRFEIFEQENLMIKFISWSQNSDLRTAHTLWWSTYLGTNLNSSRENWMFDSSITCFKADDLSKYWKHFVKFVENILNAWRGIQQSQVDSRKKLAARTRTKRNVQSMNICELFGKFAKRNWLAK